MKLWQFVAIWLLVIVALAIFTGCTTIYENGRPVLQTSSDLRGMRFATAGGTTLEAASLTNATVQTAIGNNIIKGATSVGTAIATSGVIQ